MVGDSLRGRRRGRPRARHARLPRRPRRAARRSRTRCRPCSRFRRSSGSRPMPDRAPPPGRPARRRGVARDSGARAHVVARPRRLRARVVDHDGGGLPAAGPRGVHALGHADRARPGGGGLFAFFMPLFVGPMSDATHLPLGRRRPFMVLALVPDGVCSRASSVHADLPGDGARPLRLLLRVLHLRAALPRPLPRPRAGRLLRPRPGRPARPARVWRSARRSSAAASSSPSGSRSRSSSPRASRWSRAARWSCSSTSTTWSRPATSASARSWRPPWRVVRREKHVRRFLIANTAWEATFAGHADLRRPLHHRRARPAALRLLDGARRRRGRLRPGRARGGKFGDEFGVGNVILGASVVYGLGLLVAGFAQTWHWWYYALIAPVAMAGGVVMTLAWALLFKVMPATDRGTITGPRDDDEGNRARHRPARGRGRDRHLPRLLPLDGRLRGHLAGRRDPGAGGDPARRAPRGGGGDLRDTGRRRAS